jgi:16S rRNA U516 pseudouridylate synthase RsuA-like enzyme
VVLEDGNRTERADVRFESAFGRGAWLRVALRAGKKRQIGEVVKIIRTLIGSLVLGGLRPGE